MSLFKMKENNAGRVITLKRKIKENCVGTLIN